MWSERPYYGYEIDPYVPQDSFKRTVLRTLYLSDNNTLQESAPTSTSTLSYNSESNTSPVSHAAFTLKFDKPTRLMGLPKAVLYMSCPDFSDMIVYVLIRKLDKQGKPRIAINIPWSAAPYNSAADIPESNYSNLKRIKKKEGFQRISVSLWYHSKFNPSHPHPMSVTAMLAVLIIMMLTPRRGVIAIYTGPSCQAPPPPPPPQKLTLPPHIS
ncbi:hypothetical protein G6011_08271 [Alternaria panax]|uniref:Xaa-Pro dipeptidyl-peptidase C-terminal domain-containing protein n=1 Tax=Alternaria panax TaxID=48097 RepID=A0AAD4I8I1_9PLEO|nr:hypothetical protein G6011_08271 [Alternaria panax]